MAKSGPDSLYSTAGIIDNNQLVFGVSHLYSFAHLVKITKWVKLAQLKT